MAPKLVAPYRMSGKRGKNDAADAAAICEARAAAEHVLRADQAPRAEVGLRVHRARGLHHVRTATLNRIAGCSRVRRRAAAKRPRSCGARLPIISMIFPDSARCVIE